MQSKALDKSVSTASATKLLSKSFLHFSIGVFLRIDNISDRLYAGIFKILAKSFWFSATALFNNIYVITIKQFSLLFLIGDNFVFMNKCYIVIL